MRITIAALGTRGDVQPMIALAKGLVAAGYETVLVAGANFADWIRQHGLQVILSLDMEALMNTEKALAWTESSNNPSRQVQMMKELMNEYGEQMYNSLLESAPSTDLFISSFVSEPFIQSISEKFGVPYINVLLQPQKPTVSGAASTTPILPRQNSILNRWMGKIADRILWSVSAQATNQMRVEHLKLSAHTANTYQHGRQSAPTLMGFSRHVVPPAPDWPVDTTVTGYWFLDEITRWQPPQELLTFLQAEEQPVYIGFGSMSNRQPEQTATLILEAVHQSGVRAIIAAGWGGMRADNLPNNVFAIQSAPHDWLFENVAAVVHHGGAGTTAASLRAGKPTMIVPHMSDQPYWGRRVHELGVGVKPVPRHKLTADALAEGLTQLTQDKAMREKAATLGKLIRAENGVERAIAAVEAYLRREVKQTGAGITNKTPA